MLTIYDASDGRTDGWTYIKSSHRSSGKVDSLKALEARGT